MLLKAWLEHMARVCGLFKLTALWSLRTGHRAWLIHGPRLALLFLVGPHYLSRVAVPDPVVYLFLGHLVCLPLGRLVFCQQAAPRARAILNVQAMARYAAAPPPAGAPRVALMPVRTRALTRPGIGLREVYL